MSIDVESGPGVPTSQAREVIDLSGLPAPVVEGLRSIVASLRVQHPVTSTQPVGETADGWIARLNDWIASHGVRVGGVDDDRDSIYERRGD